MSKRGVLRAPQASSRSTRSRHRPRCTISSARIADELRPIAQEAPTRTPRLDSARILGGTCHQKIKLCSPPSTTEPATRSACSTRRPVRDVANSSLWAFPAPSVAPNLYGRTTPITGGYNDGIQTGLRSSFRDATRRHVWGDFAGEGLGRSLRRQSAAGTRNPRRGALR